MKLLKIIFHKLKNSFLVNHIFKFLFLFNNLTSSKAKKNLVKKFSQENAHIFFGYYDITPFSKNNKFLLAQRVNIKNRPPKESDFLSIGYFKIDDNTNFIELGKTNTWNWQQGSRLQWYPKIGNSKIFYNKRIKKNLGSVIQDLHSGKIIEQFDMPLYDINSKGTFGLSLNFIRLGHLRPGYGYSEKTNSTYHQKEPEDDGIWFYDLKKKRKKLLFSIREISSIDRQESMDNADHYFNHISFNPNGDRFLFLHLWATQKKRFSRLLTSNLEGKEIKLLNNTGHTSHYSWKDDQHILSYSTHNDMGTNYYIYNDKTGDRNIFANGMIKHDSHPSFSTDKKTLLFDAYPNKYSVQNLYLYNENSISTFYSFFNPNSYQGEIRCDLHPRWNLNNTMICCDSANLSAYRSMYLIEV
jgi:hypothetical protein